MSKKTININTKHVIHYRLRKGDPVIIIAGKDKGKTGQITYMNKKSSRVFVQGINLVKKHRKPTAEKRSGEIIEIPAGIHVSNVMYYDNKLKKGVRIKIRRENKRKFRYSHLGRELS